MTPSACATRTTLAKLILNLVFRHRRLQTACDPCAQQACDQCFAPHLGKVERFIANGEPVHFVLPAFPAKSSNRNKTLGAEPDMGERISLRFLDTLCRQLGELYAPGARITLCGDGRVFGDLVLVSDEAVSRYRDGIAKILREIGATSLDQHTLDEEYELNDLDALREELLICHAIPLSQVQDQVRPGEPLHGMFDGIHRFIYEDFKALLPHLSSNQLRKRAKNVTYRVIQRSNAWSRAIACRFPDSVRLSIHPQPAHSGKLGIALARASNAWATPWHGVAVESSDGFLLMKRAEAEAIGAQLVFSEGRPSHYVVTSSRTEMFTCKT